MDKTSTPRMLTVDTVAKELSLSRRTIYRYIKSGQIKARKIGASWRIPRSELERLEKRGLEVRG